MAIENSLLVIALSELDAKNPKLWTSDGLPKIDEVSNLLGQLVTRAEITSAAPGFTKTNRAPLNKALAALPPAPVPVDPVPVAPAPDPVPEPAPRAPTVPAVPETPPMQCPSGPPSENPAPGATQSAIEVSLQLGRAELARLAKEVYLAQESYKAQLLTVDKLIELSEAEATPVSVTEMVNRMLQVQSS